MSKINDMLQGQQARADLEKIVTIYPWIAERGRKCILSPDSDGLLCGLFMSHFFDWQVIGYYDGKVLLLKDGESARGTDCVFLDIELYRSDVKSVGHHMLIWNTKNLSADWQLGFKNCLQPNLLRGYTGRDHFRLKYPLATIHLLIALLGSRCGLDIPVSAIAPLFFVDGTFNVLYSYPENVLNWLNFLGIESDKSPLKQIFMHEHFTVYTQILEMDKFFRKRDALSVKRERGDKFVISEKDSSFRNVEPDGIANLRVSSDAKTKVVAFLQLLSETTSWQFREEKWVFSGLKGYKFQKDNFESKKWKLNNGTSANFMQSNPLSWAMTSGTNIEFTVELPDSLP